MTDKKQQNEWHKLKQNPNDTPEEDKDVEVAYKYSGKYFNVHAYLYDGFYHESITGDIIDDEVVAWREIEPFEEEE